MNNRNPSDSATLNALERIAALARLGRMHHEARAVFLSRWLRGRLMSGIFRLRHLLTARHLPQRQLIYRNAGGSQSSAARHALARVTQIYRSKNNACHQP
ncbi:MAG: hypothetical protein ACUVSF_00105 [Anaerolineae bacterium]